MILLAKVLAFGNRDFQMLKLQHELKMEGNV